MKKIIAIPDSFKGSISSSGICRIMEETIHQYYPDCQVLTIPVADGGEGSVECFLTAMGGELVKEKVAGPYFEEMEGFYGLIDGGSTAVIEMAACAGLPLVRGNKNAAKTTTYGVGQLLLAAARRPEVKKIIVGLGGSSTNDAGCGMAAACGVKFYRGDGEAFTPVGGTLGEIAKIDASGLEACLKGVEIVTMCDIDNPLYGENGAAYIFAPQKGADEEMVRQLDAGLRHVAARMQEDLGVQVDSLPGGGAAGGMGAGMVAFFGARLEMGIQVVLDTVHFDEAARDADLVFTGEGRIDTQSLRGKVVIGVAQRAKKIGVPVIAVVGDIGDQIDAAYEMGVSAIFSINRVAKPFDEVRHRSPEDMRLTMDTIMRYTRLLDR